MLAKCPGHDGKPRLSPVGTGLCLKGVLSVLNFRLPEEQAVLLSSDSGELEVWTCSLPGCTLQYQFSMGSHDDMALCVGCLPGGDMAISGGADRRSVHLKVWCFLL